ncbi:MAG: class I mannose-6-phosphate isomerase [Lachnospiraceae bacterium]|nr:class I mannose-6-phosphate isomerase [Lachnospiraceae bacterium]
MEPIYFKPAFSHKPWGGSALREVWGYDEAGDDIGECWAVSAYKGMEASVDGGEFDSLTLKELWETKKELFNYQEGEAFPLLVKIINAEDDLSIQVHPDDDYAKEHEGVPFGKTECWYILDCEGEGSIIAGHHAKSRDEMRQMIESGDFKSFISEIRVHPGDFIMIEPGTLHAIKGGITLLEIQQSCDLTYRIYDYDRLCNGKKRELHLEKGMDVMNVPDDNLMSTIKHDRNLETELLLADNKYFKVKRICVKGELYLQAEGDYTIVSVIEGSGTLSGHPIKKGDNLILPYGFGSFELKGACKVILTSN